MSVESADHDCQVIDHDESFIQPEVVDPEEVCSYLAKPKLACHCDLNITVTAFKCPHPGCIRSYSRKYRLKCHEKSVHGTEYDECTRNFSCPFDCGVNSFRTNKELLSHCDAIHHERLGRLYSCIILLTNSYG